MLLGNDYVLPRQHTHDPDISRITGRVLDELVRPLRDVQIDDSEFACIKAIVFFDPSESEFCFDSYQSVFSLYQCLTFLPKELTIKIMCTIGDAEISSDFALCTCAPLVMPCQNSKHVYLV